MSEQTEVEQAARHLFAVGQERAKRRAAAVQALRIDRSHPLVMAVLERWGWESCSASDALAEQAIEAVDAVTNCLASEALTTGRPTMADPVGEMRDPLVGRCAVHGGMAQVYEDGSIDCHYLAVVEMHSDDCRMEPLPLVRLYGYSPAGVES